MINIDQADIICINTGMEKIDVSQESNIDLMADNFPEILLPYAKEARFDLGGWRALLKSLQDRLSSEDGDEQVWSLSCLKVSRQL